MSDSVSRKEGKRRGFFLTPKNSHKNRSKPGKELLESYFWSEIGLIASSNRVKSFHLKSTNHLFYRPRKNGK